MLMTAALIQAATVPATAKPTAAKGMDRIVCVSEAPIGSRLPGHKTCRTAADWQRDRQDSQDDTERAQRLAKMPGQ
jgi:hypothetical protein